MRNRQLVSVEHGSTATLTYLPETKQNLHLYLKLLLLVTHDRSRPQSTRGLHGKKMKQQQIIDGMEKR